MNPVFLKLILLGGGSLTACGTGLWFGAPHLFKSGESADSKPSVSSTSENGARGNGQINPPSGNTQKPGEQGSGTTISQ